MVGRLNLSENEDKLLADAHHFICMNKNYSPALGGSLMLKYIGVPINRECHDIDIIIPDTHYESFKVNDFLAPYGYYFNQEQQTSYDALAQF